MGEDYEDKAMKKKRRKGLLVSDETKKSSFIQKMRRINTHSIDKTNKDKFTWNRAQTISNDRLPRPRFVSTGSVEEARYSNMQSKVNTPDTKTL